jgi:hypothetical protein
MSTFLNTQNASFLGNLGCGNNLNNCPNPIDLTISCFSKLNPAKILHRFVMENEVAILCSGTELAVVSLVASDTQLSSFNFLDLCLLVKLAAVPAFIL